jgi:aerobic carbon-monoxide dehydrogenase small subunit
MTMASTRKSVAIALTVNGEPVAAQVEPRTHLADFLRDHLRLMGTHIGCEHGVCGACTVLIDDVPVRSCITYAVACDGLAPRTIEGFERDATMARLREAFSREHGLQCGFCTPGMLIMARDIVHRLPQADAARVRTELAGNLCRCTGYAGIINAVCSVLEAAPRVEPAAASPAAPGSRFAAFAPAPNETALPAAERARIGAATGPDDGRTASSRGWKRFEETFDVTRPPGEVWRAFGDIPAMTSCLPGAELIAHDATSMKARMRVRLGPIAAAFAGSAAMERDEAALAGTISGGGSDVPSGSRAGGKITYRCSPLPDGAGTRVHLAVEYKVQGTLAQFSRSGLAEELARRLIAEFSATLNARLAGEGGQRRAPAALNLWALLRASLAARITRLLRSMFR